MRDRQRVQLEYTDGSVAVRGPGYTVEVTMNPPTAVLAGADGSTWSRLSLFASFDTTDGADESQGSAEPVVTRSDDDVVVHLELDCARWQRKTVRLTCTLQSVELDATVTGTGTLTDVTLLGGQAFLATGACGTFRSSIGFASVYTPGPTEPVQVVRPAASATSLGVVGDAEPGRLHGIFSPPPLCLVLGRVEAQSATHIPEGPWLGLSVRAATADLTFTQMRYEPLDGGFHLTLDYDGHTQVRGRYTTPTLVFRPASGPAAALGDYRADLIAHKLAPPSTRPDDVSLWWKEPIFCGWGAQCARVATSDRSALTAIGTRAITTAPTAADFSRQDVYDELLDRLRRHGLVPGTIVIDDRWEETYGSGGPDPDRWPDMRGWIAKRHEAGQRVLLWWKAWDAGAIPEEECVLDPAGRPISVDPGNPAYRERLARTVSRMLGRDGLDADGFKIDFTQRSPAGRSLRAWSDDRSEGPGVWGIAGLHQLLGTIYSAAKHAKPDSLVITHTPHPGFADVCDMIRTNDVLERDPSGHEVPVVAQLDSRVAVVHAAMPEHPIDTDQWPMPDREAWLSYSRRQAELGVPALYYVEHIDGTGEPITAADLSIVADTWRAYRTKVSR